MDFEFLDEELSFDFNSSSIFSYVENRNVKYNGNSKQVQALSQVSIVDINELVKRYCFIYENAGIILGQLIYESQANKMSIGNRLSDNTNIHINDNNRPLERSCHLFRFLEECLLGDIPLEETYFYEVINLIRDDDNLFKITKKQFVNEDVKDFNMRVVLECAAFMIEQQKGACIKNRLHDGTYDFVLDEDGFDKMISITDIKQKLKALKAYFDIVFYQNKENGLWDGERRVWVDRRDEFKVDISLVDYNSFNRNFCDYIYTDCLVEGNLKHNYHLPERVIQKIYCKYHDELPWNMSVKCCSDNSLERPKNTSSCGNEFLVKEEDIFNIGDSFYHLCRDCGYVVKINNIKPNIKRRIIKRCSEDKYLSKKKLLLSELISLKGVEDAKVFVKSKNSRRG